MSFMSLLYDPYVSSKFWVQVFELPLPQQLVSRAEQGDSLLPLYAPRSLLAVGQMGSWNLMCTGCLQCGPQELGGRRVDWYSACFWTLRHFQFSPALNPRWRPAHGCGPAELRLWGSWALAGDVMEHSFAVVGWDLAGVQVAQPSCPHSVHLEMKPLPYSEQLLHRGHMFL